MLEPRPDVASSSAFHPEAITRPDRSLLRYYLLISILSGPAFPVVFLPLFFKYETLKYRFDDRGVSMSWGILFRKEIYLTYRRIQDIHLTRNLIQRWMGLATVSIQTASGNSGPEMSIEGILQADALRDYLYSQMRGARGIDGPTKPETEVSSTSDEALLLLQDIRDSLQRLAAQKETTP